MLLPDVIKKIEETVKSNKFGVYSKPAASVEELKNLNQMLLNKLHISLPSEVNDFLRYSNGVQICDSIFDGTKNLFSINQSFHEIHSDLTDMVYLGSEGNMCSYVFSHRNKKFLVTNLYGPSETLEEFTTFAELINELLQKEIQSF